MPTYGPYCIVPVTNTLSVHIKIKDGEPDAHTIVCHGGPNPFVLNYRGGDDTFQGIRGSEAVIQLVSPFWSLQQFISEDDEKFKVELIENDLTVKWSGWLVQDDSREALQTQPNMITLRASDGLGTLKGLPFLQWVGGSSTVPKFKADIRAYLQSALRPTNLELDIFSSVNLFEETMTQPTGGAADIGPFTQVDLEPQTFAKDRNNWDNCYEALDKILTAWGCTLFQWDNRWNVIRVEQFIRGVGITGVAYDYLGALKAGSGVLNVDFTLPVGTARPNYFITADQMTGLVRPVKQARHTYKFSIPDEVIYNTGLLKGDNIPGFPWEQPPALKTISFDGWTKENIFEAYIRILSVVNVEFERHVYILPNFPSTGTPLLKSIPARVVKGDRIRFNIETRSDLGTTASSINVRVAVIRLQTATDFYTLRADGSWAKNATNYLTKFYAATDNKMEWATVSTEESILPEDGDLSIWLTSNQFITVPNKRSDFKNITLEYKPFYYSDISIEGVYSDYSTTRLIRNKDVREVDMGSSTRPLVKGTLLKTGATKVPSGRWQRRGVTSDLKEFIQHNANALWNHRRLYRQEIEGTMKGIISFKNTLTVDGITGVTFMPVDLSIDFKYAETKLLMREIRRTGVNDGLDESDFSDYSFLYKPVNK